MLEWLKNINKEHPEFWKNYHSKFEKRSSRYVILSTQNTGLNPDKDVILSIGAISVINNSIIVGDSFEVILLQYVYLHENGLSNEFIIESKQPKLGEREAMQAFIDFIGNAVLVGHRINLIVDFINVALEKMDCGKLKNEALDIEIMYRKLMDITDKEFSIDALCDIFKIRKSEESSSSEDAYNTALLFLKLKSRLGLN
ncbi:3'-5' exonuclease [Flavobacterium psychrotolerans]|uniref:DNA polymerase III subunit epsilon n=1 Tax=Flavobacterium psychrotolerans TaxID=2169410 RepID=A0A2U1JLB2_9FLAO|nr:exonuclease domain-containing protein [Flavobacterium psychrotolerans]PWA05940.1 DNA polymerase III subunit epsilon [Flavobacterium psychrotolerans]